MLAGFNIGIQLESDHVTDNSTIRIRLWGMNLPCVMILNLHKKACNRVFHVALFQNCQQVKHGIQDFDYALLWISVKNYDVRMFLTCHNIGFLKMKKSVSYCQNWLELQCQGKYTYHQSPIYITVSTTLLLSLHSLTFIHHFIVSLVFSHFCRHIVCTGSLRMIGRLFPWISPQYQRVMWLLELSTKNYTQ